MLLEVFEVMEIKIFFQNLILSANMSTHVNIWPNSTDFYDLAMSTLSEWQIIANDKSTLTEGGWKRQSWPWCKLWSGKFNIPEFESFGDCTKQIQSFHTHFKWYFVLEICLCYTILRYLCQCAIHRTLKGKLGEFCLLTQSLYLPQTKRSHNRQFSPKNPKVGQKSSQRVQKWPNKNQTANSYCRNPPNFTQQLL